jgi:hypothetical protein
MGKGEGGPLPPPNPPQPPQLTVQPLALAQYVCDVARHDRVHLRDVGVQARQVALRARVLVQLLGLLDEGICGSAGAAGGALPVSSAAAGRGRTEGDVVCRSSGTKGAQLCWEAHQI